MNPKTSDKERSFSIELNTKQKLRNVTLNGDSSKSVLIEGTLGDFRSACFVSEDILEVAGSDGVLRVNVARVEISEVNQP
jgi:hypothetical protein